MSYFTYILQSQVDGTYYIGYTENIDKRLDEHNTGRSKYTRQKMPWKLVYFETFDVKRDAIIREKQLKNYRNPGYLEKIINQSGTRGFLFILIFPLQA